MSLVVYAAPLLNDFARQAIEILAGLPDVRLAVISGEPESVLPARPHAHWRVDNVLDLEQLAWAATSLRERNGAIDRLFSANEQVQTPLAQVRERLGIPGMRLQTALNFRDKARMKKVLRAAGVPCARFALVANEAEAWTFAERSGYPLVAKPPAGAAAQTTFRVSGPESLREALAQLRPSPAGPALLEEFITGREHSFDTFSLDGEPVWHSLTHYRPGPLTVMETPWIQWQVLLPREVDAPEYDDVREVAFQALAALGMETGMSHLEWFRREDGSLAVSEVGARPPGAQLTTLISRAHDVDSIRLWVELMVYHRFPDPPPPRRYAAGAAYLRGQGSGHVRAVHGLEQVQHEVGHLITDARIPQIGQEKGQSYEGEGYIILRHPETEVVAQALGRVVSLVRVELA